MNKVTNQTQINNRYNRQTQVTQIGLDGQPKLANAHVAIVGMGGLGCPASLYLAGAGVGSSDELNGGKLTLIDHDTVSMSNLHRQVLYRENDVGQYKSDVAKTALLALNQKLNINSHRSRLTANNMNELLANADVIVDATDNFAISYLLSDYALANARPLVAASVIGVQGYVGVFCHTTKSQKLETVPSLRAVFPNPPQVGQNCHSVGVIGTASGIMGTLQAQEVMKVILGDANQLAGKLLSIDLWSYRQSIMDFSCAPEPEVKATIISMADINDNDYVIDVRSQEEAQQQPKRLANIDIHHLPYHHWNEREHKIESETGTEFIENLPTDKRIVLTCKSGQRALSVADRLIERGFNDVAVWL